MNFQGRHVGGNFSGFCYYHWFSYYVYLLISEGRWVWKEVFWLKLFLLLSRKGKGTPPISRNKQIELFDTPYQIYLHSFPLLLQKSDKNGTVCSHWITMNSLSVKKKKKKNTTCIPQWIRAIVFDFLVGNWRLLQLEEIIYRVMKNGLTFLSASLMF